MNRNKPSSRQVSQALADAGRKLVIFGSGCTGAEACRHLVETIKAGDRILGFMDSNPLQTRRTVMGLPVRPPDAPEYRSANPLVVLASVRPWDREEMRTVCDRLGYECVDSNDMADADAPDGNADAGCEFRLGDAASRAAGTLFVDLVDSCNLRCANCLRSHRTQYNLGENVMSPETMRSIVDKAAALGYTDICYYNWTEPFLHPAVDKCVAYAEARGLRPQLSSNLSLPAIPLLFPALTHCSRLYVSVSGFSRDMHAVNHRDSDIDVVKRHLDAIAGEKRRGGLGKVLVTVKFLDFGYNGAEIGLFREYALSRGFEFEHVHGKLTRPCRESHDADAIELIARLRDSYAERRNNSLFATCVVRDAGLTLNYRGDVYLCCALLSTPFFRIGNFLTDDLQRLKILRQTHPYCAVCGQDGIEPTLTGIPGGHR